jgi:hypothetical protein
MDKSRVIEELDHPFFFLVGVSLFVAGFLGFILWGAKNTNQLGLVRLIQQK